MQTTLSRHIYSMDINLKELRRFDPLNNYLFYKVMGDKGSEIQLLGFINAVLGKT